MKVPATMFSPPLTAAVGIAAVAWQAPTLPDGTSWLVALITMAAYFGLGVVKTALELWARYKHQGASDRRRTDQIVAAQVGEIYDALLKKDDGTKRTPIDQLLISHARLFEKLDALVEELRRGRVS